MKKCPNCKKDISDYVTNCPNCGMALSEFAETKNVIPQEVIVNSNKKKELVINIALLVFGGVAALIYLLFIIPLYPLLLIPVIIYSGYIINKYQMAEKKTVGTGIAIGIIVVSIFFSIFWRRAGMPSFNVFAAWLKSLGFFSYGMELLRTALLIAYITVLIVEGHYLYSNRKNLF